MAGNGAIDIIIVNFRCHEETLGAVASVSPWGHGRIWVVDNSEDGEEAARLAQALKKHPEAQLLVAERNLGFGQGCNLAYGRSSAEHVLLLNPDARIAVPDVELLARSMGENPEWGALSPNTYWDAERRFLLPPPFPMTPASRLGMVLASRLPRRMLRAMALWRLNRLRRRTAGRQPFAVPFLVGAVLLVRRAAVDRAGGLFDPAFFMFYEDTDLSLRLRRHGYRLGIVPAATAVHGYRHKAYKLAMMEKSEKIYYQKHFPAVYRRSGGLARIDGLARRLDWRALAAMDLGRVGGAEQIASRMGDLKVVALGLPPLLAAVLFRALGEEALVFSSQEWEMLEPGRYLLVAESPDPAVSPRLLSFEKA
ncbi:MAG: glycosyltransferase [Thermodesulfobacteriota bacterium]